MAETFHFPVPAEFVLKLCGLMDTYRCGEGGPEQQNFWVSHLCGEYFMQNRTFKNAVWTRSNVLGKLFGVKRDFLVCRDIVINLQAEQISMKLFGAAKLERLQSPKAYQQLWKAAQDCHLAGFKPKCPMARRDFMPPDWFSCQGQRLLCGSN